MRIFLLLCPTIMLTTSIFAIEEVKTHDSPQKMVISCPTASLRIEPKEYIAGQEPDEQASRNMFGRFYDLFMKTVDAPYRDPLQDTQLLYNEQIHCLQELPDDWLKVEALEQYVFNRKEKKWKHMQGYIKKEQAKAVENFEIPTIVVCKPTARVSCFFETSMFLSIGTKLHGIQTLHDNYRVTLLDGKKGCVSAHDVRPLVKHNNDSIELRTNIIASAKEHIGSPYGWGARSFHNKFNVNNPGSVDCSGLINLAYRCNGIEIPRDVYPMYLKCNKIGRGAELQPGDLIFVANAERPENFNHILMYVGDNQVIESRTISKGVAISYENERFGRSLAELHSGDFFKESVDPSANYVIAFGSFLNGAALMRELNDYALGNYEIKPEQKV